MVYELDSVNRPGLSEPEAPTVGVCTYNRGLVLEVVLHLKLYRKRGCDSASFVLPGLVGRTKNLLSLPLRRTPARNSVLEQGAAYIALQLNTRALGLPPNDPARPYPTISHASASVSGLLPCTALETTCFHLRLLALDTTRFELAGMSLAAEIRMLVPATMLEH
eukprot:3940731-Rhodomonas_salina.2